MKIAMVSPAQNNYSETFIRAQKEGLDNVLFFYGGELPNQLEGFGKLKRFPHVYWYKIKRFLGVTAFSDAEQAFQDALTRSNVQVIMAHYGPTAVKILESCKQLKLPLIVHFHGYDSSSYDVLRIHGNAYKAVFIYASSVISVSKAMTRDLIELGCPKDKIYYNPCTPDDDFYEVTPDYESNTILAVGRFTEKKGSKITIRAFSRVLSKYPKARLIMIGDGPELEECKALVKELHIEENVKFIGAATKKNIKLWMSKSRAFVQHSITSSKGDKEGTPVAIQEAGLAGLPVISTTHAGIKDVVKHNVTGLLCDEGDVSGYSRHLIKILDASELARSLGESAKGFISKNYNRGRQLNRLKELVNLAIKK